MRYRREVDGLRALAVVPVILFHAGFASFKGGFVGVDIFFVISGYLITSIILKEQQNNSFSIVKFYERRARRILPALFFVVGACIPVAAIWLFPTDLKYFSQSVLSIPLFASNVTFWLTSGYFGPEADLAPLLHTWSLAVEEQFYLLFPIFIILCWPLGRNRIAALLVAITLTSLALAHWGAYNKPLATFFLLPTRAWELGIGALVAMYLAQYDHPRPGRVWQETLAIGGVVMVLLAIALYDESTPFPSLYALLPTLGTAFIVLFGTRATVAGRLLGNRLLVGIGLISFSAYLWHQPLFAFARYINVRPPDAWQMLFLAALSLLLAALTWRFVEQPFRNAKVISRTQLLVAASAASLLCLGLGAWGFATRGFEADFLARHDQRQRAIWSTYNRTNEDGMYDNGDCKFHGFKLTDSFAKRFEACRARFGKAIVIVGDSHAMDLFNAISFNTRREFIVGLSSGGCHPQLMRDYCFYEAFISFAEKHRDAIERVIFNQAGFMLIEDAASDAGTTRRIFARPIIPVFKVGEAAVTKTIAYLQRLSGYVDVTWLGPWIEPHLNAAELMNLSLRCEIKNLVPRSKNLETFERLDTYLDKRLSQFEDIQYVSAVKALELNWGRDLYDCNGVFWNDRDHFSVLGEQRFGERLTAPLGLAN